MTKRQGASFSVRLLIITAEGMPCLIQSIPSAFYQICSQEQFFPPADTSEIKSNAEIKQEFLAVV